ncbi:MAG: enoyl-CoA hydratase-related protein [Gammaproteobacteria bacterium]|jgi:enoyl-CoA hydratase/carnithine racemase|nr:enoyl-CoA hydratase [Gammaproteobacteria bacterium]MBQ08972.1 enoyl-CoA hydratase [Gammaproteobacteria bacterium]MDP6146930.1 enoyl-CoA hydratase-related protein [Gammaproteobacteria bacterium]HJL80067.1 enoyl-CoA hydratase-related protein [Gammaproteobacteria bacterium]HJM09354.1 enoyl-CoA hydratase-related protein [Gammaproteobacteria bacterium]|tara:strand:- start:1933 stop:2757 length:825 start_codon:yes stop_codon:yes gene_type:complete
MTDQIMPPDNYVFEAIMIEHSDHALTITLNRPEKKNAINDVMSNEIIYALNYAKKSNEIRAIIIQASGDVFCAGGDLKNMWSKKDETTSTVPKLGDVEDISLMIRNLNKPVVCKIQGNVLAGALMIVCNATHAIASSAVTFTAPEIKRGIWPFMVMAGLFRVMPKRQGLDFIMRGESISAENAEKYGLINQHVPESELNDTVDLLVSSLVKLPPNTMKMGLSAYNKQDQMAFNDALPYLREQIKLCIDSEDAKEGIQAFIEKRQPNWMEEKDES